MVCYSGMCLKQLIPTTINQERKVWPKTHDEHYHYHLRPFIKSLGCVTRANDLHGVTQYQQLINTTKHLRTSTSHSKERKNSVLNLFEQKGSLYSNLVISILFRPSFQPVHHCTLKFVWYNLINNSNFENVSCIYSKPTSDIPKKFERTFWWKFCGNYWLPCI